MSARSVMAPVLAACALAMFVFAPGTMADKAYAALHGLCAQRASHSLALGGAVLPMDARMTGIYLGAFVTVIWLAGMGRLRASKTPPRQVVALLAIFLLVVGLDGTNALLTDLGAAHPYEPSSSLRLVTGTLSGITLGVMLAHVFAASVWARPDHQRAVVSSTPELLAPLLLALGVSGLAASGWGVLYAPLAVGLVLSAVTVFWLLSAVVISLASGRWRGTDTAADLAPTGFAALIMSLLGMAGLAGLRFAGEWAHLIPRMT